MNGIRDELRDLLEELREDTITESGRVRLNDLLRRDPEARRFYVRYMSMTASLRYYLDDSTPAAHSAERSAGSQVASTREFRFTEEDLDRLDITPSVALELLFRSAEAARRNPKQIEIPEGRPSKARGLRSRVYRAAWRDRRTWLTAVAATLVLAVTVWFVAHSMRLELAPARITASDHARFAGDSPDPGAGGSLTQDPYELVAGHIELTYTTGVRIRVAAPATFAVSDVQELSLQRGAVHVTVPAMAKGFTVTAPHGVEVIDLGTKFEVDIDRDGYSRVDVEQGSVLVVRGDVERVLAAGQAVRVAGSFKWVPSRFGLASAQANADVAQAGRPGRLPDDDVPAIDSTLDWPPKPQSISRPNSPSRRTRASASHCWHADTVAALNDRVLPRNSNDRDLRRFTWWDHVGGTEWVQYDFDGPISVSEVAVYWFDDSPRGDCRVPQSWRLLYRSDNEWKPVTPISAYGVERDAFNNVRFQAVTTDALRLEATLQPKFSGGILEWKVK